MKATIKSISLENFKGVKSADYIFDRKNASVIGQNGAGKTTLFTAYMWLMEDKDSDLKSNPNIRPLDEEECTPRVEVVFDIDGKEVTAAKIQKCTIKKSKTGGADTISLSNSYEVNSVEYGERDFKKKMAEYGFDFDLFLPLSHPDVFTSQKSVDMRKVLFGIASEKSDKEIADMTDGAADVAEMLTNYTAEEVKAMQNATLRKIREEYGKDGEILRAKIDGMEQSKTDIDVAELELLKNALNEQISENKAKQEDISKEFEEQQKASDGILELKFELNGLQQKENADIENQRRKINYEKFDKEQEVISVTASIKRLSAVVEEKERKIAECKNNMDKIYAEWQAAESRTFDESKNVCAYCGQELTEDKKELLLKNFKDKKETEKSELNKQGQKEKERAKELAEYVKGVKEEIEDNEKKKSELEDEISVLEKQLYELPDSIDISDRPEVQEIQRKISEKEQAMNKGNSANEIRQKLKDEGEELQKQMDVVNGDIALAQKNVEIDEQILDLRKKQGEYEQNKANAEKILDQLDMVSRKKNELLTEDINKNFDIVKWQMFEYQKNGDYKGCCIPTIDGKRFGESTNTGREVLAKLDIIKGLQRFYGQNYPVFLDGAECLSDETAKRIEMDCQLIFLKVPQVVIPPLETREDMTDEEWEEAVAEWERQKKKVEDYYKELKIEMEG